MALQRLKKHKTIPYLNINDAFDPSLGDYDWARIGKSTIFALQVNAQTEENNFIEDEFTTSEVMYYQPGMDQELQANKGDPAFDYIYAMFKALPTGEDVKKKMLMVFAGDNADGSNDAWLCDSTITLTEFNTVDEKITFSININKIVRGTVKPDLTGKPEFTAA